mgnify:CR=1 FL=1
MGKVLIIGAGGVGTVVAHKVAQNPDVFTDIMIASRTKSNVMQSLKQSVILLLNSSG